MPTRLAAAGRSGIGAASSLEDLAKKAELFVVIVSTDEQSGEVTDALSRQLADNALIAIAATNGPMTMKELDKLAQSRGKRFIDAPGRLWRDRRAGGQPALALRRHRGRCRARAPRADGL